ncbi:uncharacterized protein LOC127157306 [Labeo rohita]|uniref:uncharacterized protein LOC127157306 n=1 Tax=Labeo rohita TaxID=84645 RepID=UPI0021E2B8C5|nr:uncharacterized protein LOC127157306 [Labeo rohita]
MPVNHLLLLLVFLPTFKTGFSAEITVFAMTGASVRLDLQTHLQAKINGLEWEKDNSTSIVRYVRAKKQLKYDSSYKKRTDFNIETFSVTLNNIEDTDNGLYTATANDETLLAAYKLYVYDEVVAPVLTVNSNLSSSDYCIVNFTCRSHYFTLNSTYNSGSCSPKKEISDEMNAAVQINCSEKYIICNLSNPVSWKEDKIYINELCVDKDQNPEEYEKSAPWWLVGVGVLMIILACPVILYLKSKKGGQMEVVQDSTVYAQVETQEMQKLNSDCNTYDIPEQVQAKTQKETGDKRPETTYCTVGQHQKPTITPDTDRTIYASVCKLSTKDRPANSSDDTLK